MEQSDEFSVNAIHEGAGGMRELLAIALPMVVSQACDTIMMFTDRLFLSRLGPEEMNASMAGGLMCFVMMTFFLGLTGYSTALVAQYLGSGRKDRCATATTQAMLIALTAYPLILLARPLVHFAFAKTGISPGQLTPQIEYFDVVIYATVIGLLRNCMSSFFSGIGRTRIVMISAVTAMLVNVGMNYILIFGKLGFPALGIRGAAYATIIGGCVGLGVLLTTYLSGRTRRTFRVWHSLRFDREAMGKLLRFGYPAGIEMFLNLMAFNVMIIAFHAHSPATATAVTVMFNWDMVSFVPLIGIQIGVMSLVGRYMGAGNPDLAHRSAISGLKCGWLYSVFILMLFVFLPKHLVDVFRPEQVDAIFHEAAPIAVRLIRIASIYVMLEAVVVVFSGTLRGAGDTFWAMCVSVTIHWLMLGILVTMLYVLRVRPEVAWLGVVVSFLSFSYLFYRRFRGGKWRTIRVVHSQAELIATDHDHDFHEPRDL